MIRTNSLRAGGRHYARYLAHYAGKNHTLLVLGALFILGVTFGALLIRTADGETLAALLRVVNRFIEDRRDYTFAQNILSACASSLIFVGAMFVCGFCAISQPIIAFTPFFRGLGFGFSAASLYASHGVGVTGFIALFILPNMLISSLAILICCRESLRLSNHFWSVLWGGENRQYRLRIYIGRYIAASVLCIASAFLESVLYFAFANYFVLR